MRNGFSFGHLKCYLLLKLLDVLLKRKNELFEEDVETFGKSEAMLMI